MERFKLDPFPTCPFDGLCFMFWQIALERSTVMDWATWWNFKKEVALFFMVLMPRKWVSIFFSRLRGLIALSTTSLMLALYTQRIVSARSSYVSFLNTFFSLFLIWFSFPFLVKFALLFLFYLLDFVSDHSLLLEGLNEILISLYYLGLIVNILWL